MTALDVECPTCGAMKGDACRGGLYSAERFHPRRCVLWPDTLAANLAIGGMLHAAYWSGYWTCERKWESVGHVWCGECSVRIYPYNIRPHHHSYWATLLGQNLHVAGAMAVIDRSWEVGFGR